MLILHKSIKPILPGLFFSCEGSERAGSHTGGPHGKGLKGKFSRLTTPGLQFQGVKILPKETKAYLLGTHRRHMQGNCLLSAFKQDKDPQR